MKKKKILTLIFVIILIMQFCTISLAEQIAQTTEELFEYDLKLQQEDEERIAKQQEANEEQEKLNKKVKEIFENNKSESVIAEINGEITSKVPQTREENSELTEEIAPEEKLQDVGATGDDNSNNGNWTDFTNAKVTFEWDDNSNLIARLSGIDIIAQNYYQICFGTDKENITVKNSENIESFSKVKDKNEMIATLPNSQMILNKTFYYVIAEGITTPTVDIKAKTQPKEIERPELPNIGTRMDLYMPSSGKSTAFLKPYNDNSLNLKINYKIGKINDNNILKTFKTDSDKAYKDLMEYAKKQQTYLATGSVKGGENDFNPVEGKSLEKNGYYFAYFELDTENGKYIDIEDVAIYQENAEFLVHFAFAGINVSDDALEGKDSTVSKEPLPFTGAVVITGFVALSSIIVYFAYKRNKSLNDVK